MSINTEQAAQIITDEVNATAASAPQSAASAAAVDMNDFCSLWDTAKPILETVSGIITLFPGLGTTAAGVLRGLIKVGDMIHADQC